VVSSGKKHYYFRFLLTKFSLFISYNCNVKLEEFKSKLQERNITLSDDQIALFNCYAEYLKEYNEKINLTAITEYEDVLEKHFYDCLLLVDRKLEGTLVDVGTGAGFPGVVLKIALPNLHVILVEPLHKRCVFLQSLIDKLGIKGIDVINERGEDYSLKHREEYDYVTARAVSNLNGLMEVCGALVKEDGYFICLRGKEGINEIKEASKAIEIMGFKVENTNEECLTDGSNRIISYFKKIKKTPVKYPRKYSIIKQHAL